MTKLFKEQPGLLNSRDKVRAWHQRSRLSFTMVPWACVSDSYSTTLTTYQPKYLIPTTKTGWNVYFLILWSVLLDWNKNKFTSTLNSSCYFFSPIYPPLEVLRDIFHMSLRDSSSKVELKLVRWLILERYLPYLLHLHKTADIFPWLKGLTGPSYGRLLIYCF